jgi:hypothetical protein
VVWVKNAVTVLAEGVALGAENIRDSLPEFRAVYLQVARQHRDFTVFLHRIHQRRHGNIAAGECSGIARVRVNHGADEIELWYIFKCVGQLS